MVRRILGVFAIVITFALSGVLASAPAVAQESPDNPNPIDWTVTVPFIGKLGDEIPLRVGQNDFKAVGLTMSGFGERHIRDAHGVVPPPDVINDVLQTGACISPSLERFVCTNDEAEVVFVRTTDPRSGDRRPFGIITAYFKAPDCGC